jgi:hypothetical protein
MVRNEAKRFNWNWAPSKLTHPIFRGATYASSTARAAAEYCSIPLSALSRR